MYCWKCRREFRCTLRYGWDCKNRVKCLCPDCFVKLFLIGYWRVDRETILESMESCYDISREEADRMITLLQVVGGRG